MSLTTSPRLFCFALVLGVQSGSSHPPSLGGNFLSSPEAERQNFLLLGQHQRQVSGARVR